MIITQKIKEDVDGFIAGTIEIEKLYNLSYDDKARLTRAMESYLRSIQDMRRIVAEAERRDTKVYFTFERDINIPDGDWSKDYSFIQNLSYDFRYLFPEWEDNYDATSALENAKVTGKNTIVDPEMCCSYFYFKTKKEAEAFINRLNKFFAKRQEETKK